MTDLEIRAMTPADVEPAVAMYRAGGWGERREYLEWELANPAIGMLVGICDGALVGTATASSTSFWASSGEYCRFTEPTSGA